MTTKWTLPSCNSVERGKSQLFTSAARTNSITSVRSGDADTLLNDRTFIEEMKADILRRAQEQEEDSDHEERRGPLKEIDFEEDLDDELAKPSFTLAKVDGEDTGDEDASDGQDENEGAVSFALQYTSTSLMRF